MFRSCLLPVGNGIRGTIKTGIAGEKFRFTGKIKELRIRFVVFRQPVHEN